MQIVVLTSFDIRIYDCITGRLKRIINSLNNFNSDAELTALVFDSRNRVFVILEHSRVLGLRTLNFMRLLGTVMAASMLIILLMEAIFVQ